MPTRDGGVYTTTGEKIGMHDGAQFVTIGQRHGLNLRSKYQVSGIKGMSETKAHYVVERNMATNTIVVAEEDDPTLYRKEISVTNVNWIAGDAPQMPLRCCARIRHRQPLQHCQILFFLRPQKKEYLMVFDIPQRAVASGQSAVFYAEDGVMLGGGVIE
jgi:tRNA-specific 2-thiouridylase